jgi:predicted transposase YbfD/YdcC
MLMQKSLVIRSHWSIENSLYYVKDVEFKEDASRVRTKQSPSLLSLITSFAINILNINNFQNKIQARKTLAWDFYKLLSLTGI